ncbi:transcriptional regulator [Vibrio ishigakensis]|uniref:Transcriptional regulator n=1 Tax=Vibrio ishigakensis TaxID=1481914 RepID=A0A0B8PBR2_9VIBR|nr:transcriptional regulator [Vibrio ishigakensis]
MAQKMAIFSNALSHVHEPGLGLKVGQQARFSDLAYWVTPFLAATPC